MRMKKNKYFSFVWYRKRKKEKEKESFGFTSDHFHVCGIGNKNSMVRVFGTSIDRDQLSLFYPFLIPILVFDMKMGEEN
jgi:hypothetical protein